VITWFNINNTFVALNSIDTEYIVVSMDSCEAIWIKKFLTGIFDQALEPTVIYCNNESFIKLFENPIFYDNSNHIEIVNVLNLHRYI
jgi:hypothetical protein